MAICLKVKIVMFFFIQSLIENKSISMLSQCSCPSERTDALAAAPAPTNWKCLTGTYYLFLVLFSQFVHLIKMKMSYYISVDLGLSLDF